MAHVHTVFEKLWENAQKFFRQLEPVEFVVDKQANSRIKPNIICHFQPKSIIAEEYRAIRTNLQFALAGHEHKSFLITSSVNDEGKSVTTLNLATVIAQSLTGPVLVVDCDLRKPTMHRYLGLEMAVGLVDYLEGRLPLEALIKTTEIPNIHAITIGKIPGNPSEMLGGAAMETFISEAKRRYEYVIFDTPPIIPVTDAAVLGPKLDGAVVLIKTAETQRETVNHAARLLKQANTHILGFVLTNAKQYIPKYLYRYQYYHYYHYYHYKQDEKGQG
jgi:capsular exopolysaccharide synthesis family protein